MRAFVLFFSLILTGCAGIEAAKDSPVARLTVQAATLKVIDHQPGPAARHDKAFRVLQLVDRLNRLIDEGLITTTDQLYEALDDHIDWSKLDLAETLLVNEVVGMVKVELEKRIAEQVMNDGELLVIRDLLGWVRSAAIIAELQYRGAQ